MEGAFRLLVENCDNFQVGSVSYHFNHLLNHLSLQGLQMMHDTPTFGGFSRLLH
jgi:hypothetical protein